MVDFIYGRYEASYASGKSGDDYIPFSKKSTSASSGTWANTVGRVWQVISQLNTKKASKNMYSASDSIESHLPYGIEWDTTMQWLINSGAKTEYEVVTDSTSWGNYLDDTFSGTTGIANTGEFEETKVNNMYDLAGNVREWLQENNGSGTNRTTIRSRRF